MPMPAGMKPNSHGTSLSGICIIAAVTVTPIATSTRP